MAYDFSSLSHGEFEDLARDLVGREIELRFEAFPEGPDDGMDGRHARADGSVVMQAKHYRGSGFAALKSKMTKERQSIDRLARDALHPSDVCATYAKEQERVSRDHRPIAANAGRRFRPGDLNALLRKYPDIEKAHQKLWAQSTSVLQTVITEAVGKALSKPEALAHRPCQSPAPYGGYRKPRVYREKGARHHISNQGVADRRRIRRFG